MTMSRDAQALFSLLLMGAFAATGLADVPPSPPPPTIPGLLPPGVPSLLPPGLPGLLPPGLPGLFPPGIPGLSPQGNPAGIAKCWSSLQNVPGCVWEVYTSIFTGKFTVGPACCKAFQAIDQNCLLNMFPLIPSFPPLIKSNCAQVNVNAAAAAPEAGGSKQY